MTRIYLDHAATSPVRPEARAAMLRVWDEAPGNPASAHAEGRLARAVVAEARAQVAALVGERPEAVVFTAGATEASNLAIRGAAAARRGEGRHVVSTRIEHSASKRACEALAEDGWRVTLLETDPRGRVDPYELARAAAPGTVLVSVIAGHNELGTVQDLSALADAAHAAGALLHLDAVQTAGYVDLSAVPWDFLSLTGHKLGGPKGIGALVMRGSPAIAPILVGGSQEGGVRPGTTPVALAAGFGAAAAAVKQHRQAEATRLAALRDRLGTTLCAALPGSAPVGCWADAPEQALPHVLLLGIDGLRGPDLVQALDDAGIAASSSSACLGDARSHVLDAIHLPDRTGTLRLSLGWNTSAADVDEALRRIPAAVARLRSLAPFDRLRRGFALRAEEAGLALSDLHWLVAEAVFSFHQDSGVLPGPRHLARLANGTPLGALFPRGMVTVASWLGIPVPHGGCKPNAL